MRGRGGWRRRFECLREFRGMVVDMNMKFDVLSEDGWVKLLSVTFYD